MISEIERITGPEYVVDLTALPIDDVRAKRAECNAVENAMSYVRRFAQARLDMLARLEPGVEMGELPTVLTEREQIPPMDHGAPALPRPPQDFSPNVVTEELLAELDSVAPIASFREAGNDPELANRLIAGLSDFERSISDRRREVHAVIDVLQSEIVRRYRVGEASVDGLLRD